MAFILVKDVADDLLLGKAGDSFTGYLEFPASPGSPFAAPESTSFVSLITVPYGLWVSTQVCRTFR
ncbi:hypothetical protein, partial [Arthrobacter sp. H14]|uniref:hypothetical protein n=1 Tax=Arthrobacter sp. H14 TaxID=1312959 RepID=UPI001C1E8995